MKKRTFIKVSSTLATGVILSPIASSCHNTSVSSMHPTITQTLQPFALPSLGYAFDALEPHIDAQTMEIHHGKHHAGYVNNLNKALEGMQDKTSQSLELILANLSDDTSTVALRNNGGGHYNHSLFWTIIGPNKGGLPTGALATAINEAFGSYDNFQVEFSNAAKTVFGSGWVWLAKNDMGKLFISKTPNQDNPLMKNLVAEAGVPILGIDVWEHAYYLKYQNLRAEYIKNFFNLIDWDEVAKRFSAM